MTLVNQQITVVKALQTRLSTADETAGRMQRSGDVKDLSVALGCAIDKLEVLLKLEHDGFLSQRVTPTVERSIPEASSSTELFTWHCAAPMKLTSAEVVTKDKPL